MHQLRIQCISYRFILVFFISTSFPFHVSAGEDITIVTLNLNFKAAYITCCDINADGLKEIIAANENNITIFWQNPRSSFRPYNIQIEEKIIALNAGRLSKSPKESIICLGENRLLYFSLGDEEKIEGPNYIEISPHESLIIDKQRGLKNFSFVLDFNNDGLDDIIIPTNKGPLILWQMSPLFFTPYILHVEKGFINATANVRFFPKSDKEIEGFTKGISFFPSVIKELNYWIQDYNNDNLLDVVALGGLSDGYTMTIYLQDKNNTFDRQKDISLQFLNGTRPIDELQLLDWDNDGFQDLIETNIEYPLDGNTSLLPLLDIKIHLGTESYSFDEVPKYFFKTVFLPGLDNITDLDQDGFYEIITSTSPLRLGSKESTLRAVTDKKIIFSLSYVMTNKKNGFKNQVVDLGNNFCIKFSDFKNLDNFRQFIEFKDLNGDGIVEMLFLNELRLLEIKKFKKNKGTFCINETIEVVLPHVMSEISSIDINSDMKSEFLTLDLTGKTINIIYLDRL